MTRRSRQLTSDLLPGFLPPPASFPCALNQIMLQMCTRSLCRSVIPERWFSSQMHRMQDTSHWEYEINIHLTLFDDPSTRNIDSQL